MGTSKLKNMVLLLLVIVNAALLVLVIPTRLAIKRQAGQADALLSSLFEQENIRLDAESIPADIPVTQSALPQKEESALAAAKVLLGADATQEEDIYGQALTGERGDGLVQGNFLSLTLSQPVSNPLDFTNKTLVSMGAADFTLKQESQEEDVSLITAEFLCQGLPLVGGEMMFCYEQGVLTEVSGFFLPKTATPEPQKREPCLSAEDALISFLEYAKKTAWTGEEILSLRQCWLLDRTEIDRYLLQPMWVLTTDAGHFTVDGLSGAVSSAS